MEPQPDIAAVAAHFADRSRARMLMELIDGSTRPVTRLAQAAGIATSTASEHLARLAHAGLVRVEPDGRVRRYRLAGPQVVLVLEALLPLASTPAPSGLREHTRWERLRVARSCYDHLAGTLGTDLLAGLLEAGALLRTDGIEGTMRGPHDRLAAAVVECPYALGPVAAEWFAAIGLDLATVKDARRPLIRCCTDWTEQRHHLAGGLGAAIMGAMIERGWIERREGRRDVRVHQPDRIEAWLTAS